MRLKLLNGGFSAPLDRCSNRLKPAGEDSPRPPELPVRQDPDAVRGDELDNAGDRQRIWCQGR